MHNWFLDSVRRVADLEVLKCTQCSASWRPVSGVGGVRRPARMGSELPVQFRRTCAKPIPSRGRVLHPALFAPASFINGCGRVGSGLCVECGGPGGLKCKKRVGCGVWGGFVQFGWKGSVPLRKLDLRNSSAPM